MARITAHEQLTCNFRDWIRQQESDLEELLRALDHSRDDADSLKSLVQKNLLHFREYSSKRRELSRRDAPTLFCPSWCTTFENCFLWMGGCRPSMVIRLLYALSGSHLESRLHELLSGSGEDSLGLSASQLRRVNDLHARTLRLEDKLSARMAALQEDVADLPLLQLVKEREKTGRSNGEVEAAMSSYEASLSKILEEADELRIETLREMVEDILTPLQAVELLTAAKQLHLSVHEWGRCRDRQHGRSASAI